MALTAADLAAAHLNQLVTIEGTTPARPWSMTGRLAGIEHEAEPDLPIEGEVADDGAPAIDQGRRTTTVTIGLGDASAIVEVDQDHPVSVVPGVM